MDGCAERLRKFLGISQADGDRIWEIAHRCSNCTCSACLAWWVAHGPHLDGSYGPFTKEEIDAERTNDDHEATTGEE